MTVIVPSNSFIDSRISSGSRGPSSTIERRLLSLSYLDTNPPPPRPISPLQQLLFPVSIQIPKFLTRSRLDVNKTGNAIRTNEIFQTRKFITKREEEGGDGFGKEQVASF